MGTLRISKTTVEQVYITLTRRKLTQAQLSTRVGVSTGSISVALKILQSEGRVVIVGRAPRTSVKGRTSNMYGVT